MNPSWYLPENQSNRHLQLLICIIYFTISSNFNRNFFCILNYIWYIFKVRSSLAWIACSQHHLPQKIYNQLNRWSLKFQSIINLAIISYLTFLLLIRITHEVANSELYCNALALRGWFNNAIFNGIDDMDIWTYQWIDTHSL